MLSILLTMMLSAQAEPVPYGTRADKVLLWCGSRMCAVGERWVEFQEAHANAGIELDVVTTARLPTDLSRYRTVWLGLADFSFDAAEVAGLYDFLLRGRRLVMVSEYHNYSRSYRKHNEVLAALHVPARFQSRTVDPSCETTSDELTGHRLGSGLTDFDYAASTLIVGGEPIVEHSQGVLVAFDRPGKKGPPNGEVVLVGDASAVNGDCESIDNMDWVVRLATD